MPKFQVTRWQFQRIPRRELELRRYYLRGVAAAFDTDPDTLEAWLSGRTPVPAWIPALAINAYRIPPPPAPRVPILVRWILLTVVAGAAAVLALARWG